MVNDFHYERVPDMDEIDKKIIASLRVNSRISWKELGQKIHMTGQAVGLRVERLLDTHQIRKFTVEVACLYTEFITVYMGTQRYDLFERNMLAHNQIESVHRISGDGCYLLIAHFSPEELEIICKELLTFGRYKINISLNRVK